MAFNVAGGEGISLLRLLDELRALAGSPLAPEFRSTRAGEVRHSRADITRAQRLLGFTPDVTLRAGLRRTLEPALRNSRSDRFLAAA